MINVTFTKEKEDYIKITTTGHALFSKNGDDIVCAAVSALVINTINSIDKFTDCNLSVYMDQEDGVIDAELDNPNSDSNLLMKSLVLGLEGIIKSYSDKYLQINIKEV